MEEPEEILRQVAEALAGNTQDLKGKRIMITSGPTHEKIDPVRFIGNYSSGKMGCALAEECARRGAEVEMVCGLMSQMPKHPSIICTNVESAAQMYEACVKIFPTCNAGILCAAVADFTPEHTAENKIKREGDQLVIRLNPTQDIAQAMGQMKRQDQKLVGFALETCNEAENARKKLEKKNLDFIVLNSLNDEGAGFQHDTNKITLIDATESKSFPLKSKTEAAKDIINRLKQIMA